LHAQTSQPNQATRWRSEIIFLFCPLAKAYARSAAVLVDELDASRHTDQPFASPAVAPISIAASSALTWPAGRFTPNWLARHIEQLLSVAAKIFQGAVVVLPLIDHNKASKRFAHPYRP
jgi:hypothetical protein